jgi:DNA-binding beta-propeller fold protein YncE
MKRVLPLLILAFLGAMAGAQDRVAVTFKVFPPDYELFSGGERLPYVPRAEGLRSYQLPTGAVRVNLSATGQAPLSLALDVKAGMATVQAKLEPRQGPLLQVTEAASGKAPRNLTFTADGKRLLVALQGEPGVEVYEVPSLKRLDRLAPTAPAPSGYTDVAVVGAEVWAVQRDGSVHVFDGATLAFKETFRMPNGGNATLTLLAPGKVALADWDNSKVSFLDTATRKPTAVLPLGGSLRGFGGSSSVAYGVLFDRAQVAVIDPATGKVKNTWAVGKAPRPVAIAGTNVFVGDMGSAQVLVLDQAGKVVKSVAVPSNPHQMAVSADRSLVAVASRGRNNPVDYQLPGPDFGRITLLGARGEVLATVWGRNQPTGLAFSADGKYLAFTDILDNNVELYRVTL